MALAPQQPPSGNLDGLASMFPDEPVVQQAPPSLDGIAELFPKEDPVPPAAAKVGVSKKIPKKQLYEDALDTTYPENVLRDPVNYLSQYRAVPSIDLVGMAPTTQASAAKFFHHLAQKGLKPVIESGKRDGGGRSYHDHGEAIDINIYDGKGNYLSPSMFGEVKQLAAETGFGGIINETDPYVMAQTRASGPHIHLSMGPEFGTDLAKIRKGKRATPKPSAIVQHQPKPGDSTVSPDYVHSIAKAHGWDDPNDLLRQLKAESGLRSRDDSGNLLASRGPDGKQIAFGIAQFTPATLEAVGPRYGITPEEYYKNPAAQVRLASLYMLDLVKSNGGSKAKALYEYNAGGPQLQDFLAGKANIPDETRNYIAKVLQIDPNSVDEAVKTGTGDKKFNPTPQLQRFEEDKKSAISQAWDFTKLWGKNIVGNYWDTQGPMKGLEDQSNIFKEVLEGATFGISRAFGMKPTAEMDVLRSGASTTERMALSLPWFLGNVLTTELLAGKLGATTMFTRPGETIAPGTAASAVDNMLDWTKHLIPEAGSKGALPSFARLFFGSTPEYAKSVLTYAGITGVNVATESAVKHMEQGTPLREAIPSILADGIGGTFMGTMMGFGFPALIGGVGLVAGESALMAGKSPVVAQGIGKYLYGAPADASHAAAQRLLRGAGGVAVGAAGAEVVNAATGSDIDPWVGAAAGALGASALGPFIRKMPFLSQAEAATAAQPPASAVLEELHPGARSAMTGMLSKWWNGLKEYNKQIIEGTVQDHTGKYFKATQAAQKVRTYEEAMANVQATEAKFSEIGAQQSRLISGAENQFKQSQERLQALQTELAQIPGGKDYLEWDSMIQDSIQKLPQIPKEEQALFKTQIDQLSKHRDTLEKSLRESYKNQTLKVPGELDPIQHLTQIKSQMAEAQGQMSQWQSQWGQQGEKLTEMRGHLDSTMKLARYQREIFESFQKPEIRDEFLKIDHRRLADDAEYRAQIAERTQSELKQLPDYKLEKAFESDHNQAFLQSYKEAIVNKVARSLAGDPIPMREVEDTVMQGLRTLYDPDKQLTRFLTEQREQLTQSFKSGGNEKFAFSDTRPQDAVVKINWENRGNILNEPRSQVVFTDPAVLSDHLRITPELVGLSKEEMEAKIASLLGKAEANGVLKFPKLTLKKGALSFRKPHDGFIDDAFRDEILSIEVAKRMGDSAIPVRLPKGGGKVAQEQLEKTFSRTKNNALSEAAFRYQLTDEFLKLQQEAKFPTVPGVIQGSDDVYDSSQAAVTKRLLQKHVDADDQGLLKGKTPLGEKIVATIHGKNVPFEPDKLQEELQAAMRAEPQFNGFTETTQLLRNTLTPADYKQLFQNEIATMGQLLEDKNSPASLLGKLMKDPTEVFKQPVKMVDNLRDLINQADHGIMDLANRNVQQILNDGGLNWTGVMGYAKNFIPAMLMNRKQSISVMATGVADQFNKMKLNDKQMAVIKSALDDPKKISKAIQDPQVKSALGYFMDILGLVQKQEAHRPELVPAAERIYLLRKYPNLSYFAQRREGNLLSRTDLVNRLKVYQNDPDELFTRLMDHGPLRYDKNTGEHSKKVKNIFGPYSADVIHEGQMRGSLLRSTEDQKAQLSVEEMAKRVRKGVLKNEKGSVDRLMSLDPDNSEHHAQLIKMTQTEELYRESPTKAVDRWKDMQVLFLMENGERNVGELLANRLSSVFDAHSEQEMLRNFSQLMITGHPNANEMPQYALEVRQDGQSPPRTHARYKSEHTKVNKGIEGWIAPKYESTAVEHEPLSKIFGDNYAYIDGTGKAIPAKNVFIHPDLAHYLDEYALTKPTTSKGMFFEKARDLIRHFALVGGPMPHALNTMSNVMMQHAMNPLRAFGLVSKGEKLMQHEDRYFLLANAIRHGLNPKISHAMTQAISEQIFSMTDPETKAILTGASSMVPIKPGELDNLSRSAYSPPYPQSQFLKLMKAMDVGPEAGPARESLSANRKFFADFAGFAPKVDAMMARAMIVEPLQQAQLAAFYNHSVEIMQRGLASNPGVSKEMLWKQAQEAASIKVNQMSGALPYYFTPDKWRQRANSWLLTPNWAMGKAQAILGALEPVLGLTNKGLKQHTMFGHLAEPIRQDLYKQYASALTVGTMSFIGATQALNFLMNGHDTLDSQNSKDWFRVKIGDHMYSNPLYGFYREFARSIGGVIGENSIEPVLENLTRQLLPGASGLAASLTGQQASIRPSGVSGQMGDIAGNILEQASSGEEVFGTGGGTKGVLEIFGLKAEDGKIAAAPRMRGKEWALRLMGVYRSDYNTPAQIERKYQEEQQYWMNQSKTEVGRLIQAGLDANDPVKGKEFIGRAFELGVLRGVRTDGKFAEFQREKTGTPYLTMSFDQFMNVLNRKSSPYLYGVDVASRKKGPMLNHMIQELDRVNKSWDEAIRSQFEFSPVDLGADVELQRAEVLGD